MAGTDIYAVMTLVFALSLFVSLGISSLVLQFMVKRQKFKVKEYKYALLISVAVVILILFLTEILFLLPVGYESLYLAATCVFPLIELVVSIALIRYIYKEDWKTSAKVGILWWVASLIIAFVLASLIALPLLYSMGVFS